MGAKGCLTMLEDDNDVHILFDFGQTKIKRLIAVRRYDNSHDEGPESDYYTSSYGNKKYI